MTAVVLFSAAVLQEVSAQEVSAQQSYTYSVAPSRARTLLINWKPEENTLRRYTVSVSPLRLVSNGLKFDFERELRRPGHWFGTSLTGYIASPRTSRYDYWDDEGNNRGSFNSGWDSYHRMWGLGTSAFFKNTFHRSGWYFSTGLTFEFFRVGVSKNRYIPYVENGLTFYDYGRSLETKSYFKPTAQFNLGKHFAISPRCYFDLYAGLGLTYSLYKDDNLHPGNNSRDYRLFDDMAGFAYRGLLPVGGFRFGVLLWRQRPQYPGK